MIRMQWMMTIVLALISIVPYLLHAQQPGNSEGQTAAQPSEKPADNVPLDERSQKFQKLLTGAKLSGLFTIEGKPLKDLTEDTYEIRKVTKGTASNDQWIITSRVKYGKNDYEMPFPIEVKWAGETPVLTLEKLAVPGFGVFSARVVLHGSLYAGTWQHDSVGGHMFGNIQFKEQLTTPEK